MSSSLFQSRHTPRGRIVLAGQKLLKALVVAPPPLLNLLESMQYEAVVIADAFALICPTEYATKSFLWPGSCPQWWKKPRLSSSRGSQGGNIILHVLPRWDSISNYIRTERRPFCSSYPFKQLIARASSLTRAQWPSQRPLHLWDVGANLGDCDLAAAAILRAGP